LSIISFVVLLSVALATSLTVFLPSFFNKIKTENVEKEIDKETIESVVASGAELADASSKGGIIHVEDGATYNMLGGTLSDYSADYGGAVYVSGGGTFNMLGGEISNNVSKYGGAIYVASGGVCNIINGEISNNNAIEAPAIFAEQGATVNIQNEDAIIKNNHVIDYYYINYYLNGTFVGQKEVDATEAIFTAYDLPYNYEQTCGYFVDENLTIPIEDGQKILAYTNDAEAAQSVMVNKHSEINVYTKYANHSNFNLAFTEVENGYSVKALTPISGDLVLPKVYNGKYVVKIDDSAFKNSTSLKTATIPSSVKEISSQAFYGCKALTSVNFNRALKEVNDYAFYNCTSLAQVDMANSGIKTIGDYSFFSCSKITKLSFSNVLTEIGSRAFRGVNSLTTLNLPNSLKTIKDRAFQSCHKLSGQLVIPESVEKIEDRAFDMCSKIEYLVIKPKANNTISLGEGVFGKTTSMKMAYIASNSILKKQQFQSEDVNVPSPEAKFMIFTDAESTPNGWQTSNSVANCWNYSNYTQYLYKTVYGVSYENYQEILDYINNFQDTTVTKYEGVSPVVVLPSCVTNISSKAFENKSIKEIIFLSDNLPTIADDAFNSCSYSKITTFDKSLDGKLAKYTWNVLPDDELTGFAGGWISTTNSEYSPYIEYNKTYGDGTRVNPYLISTLEQFKKMMQVSSVLKSTTFYNLIDEEVDSLTEAGYRIDDYGTVKVRYDYFDGAYTFKNFDSSGKLYFRLINNIDFTGEQWESVDSQASISLDGYGFSLNNISGETYINDSYPALIQRAYDCEISNLTINYGYEALTLLRRTYGETVLSKVVVDVISEASYIFMNEIKYNYGPFVCSPQTGSVTFKGCVNNADIKSVAPYFGLFVGGYPQKSVVVNFNNCVNNGDIYTGFVAGIFFGNNYIKPKYTISNFVNNGSIYGKQYYRDSSSYNYESHVLAPLTSTAASAFTKADVKMYDTTTSGAVVNKVTAVQENKSTYTISNDGNGYYSISAPEGQVVPSNKTFTFLMRVQVADNPNGAINTSLNLIMRVDLKFDGTNKTESLGQIFKGVIDRDSYNKKFGQDVEDNLFTHKISNVDYMFASINNYYVVDLKNEYFTVMKSNYTQNQSNGSRMWTILVTDNETGLVEEFICKIK